MTEKQKRPDSCWRIRADEGEKRGESDVWLQGRFSSNESFTQNKSFYQQNGFALYLSTSLEPDHINPAA